MEINPIAIFIGFLLACTATMTYWGASSKEQIRIDDRKEQIEQCLAHSKDFKDHWIQCPNASCEDKAMKAYCAVAQAPGDENGH